MTIKRCDKCEKKLQMGDVVVIMPGIIYESVELCQKCAAPVMKTLKKYEILQESPYKFLPGKTKAL